MLDREKINMLVRQLWIEFNKGELSDFSDDADLDLWTKVTEHPAIQDRLTKQTTDQGRIS